MYYDDCFVVQECQGFAFVCFRDYFVHYLFGLSLFSLLICFVCVIFFCLSIVCLFVCLFVFL